jgi:hypothetical protein
VLRNGYGATIRNSYATLIAHGLISRRKPQAMAKKGVCGTTNAKNAMGRMTGPRLVVFDGEKARIMVSNAGPENPTFADYSVLGVMLGETLKMHEKFCK